MNWSSFKYLVKQGWHNMVANRLMTVASLGVLTACLVITGIAGILSVSVSNFVQSLGDKDMIEVFISDEATDEQIEAWSQQLPQLANVASCTFISKAQAVEDMKAEMGEYADVLQDYEGEGNEANPLPASFRIYVTDIALLNDTVAAIQQVGGDLFYRINSPTELGDILVQMRRVVNIAGWGLVAVLGIVSVVIISNTIRLTVFARRREINIMKFVGATNAFIRMPFFVEGMTVGALAGLLSTVLVGGAYFGALQALAQPGAMWLDEFTQCLYPFSVVILPLAGIFILFGMFIGSAGCAFSIRKHLKV
ncbi:MAG TPA: permease-like cell division protein FtsX [Candidatus Ruthenibacterium merdipullorum]|nr:permease-like cell division protein FtsX [Candidatus Ruthenibacterium merdipullorum]